MRRPAARSTVRLERVAAELALRTAGYPAARAAAQARADETGMDIGLEWLGLVSGWVARALPCRENRYGHERWCEVVMCSDVSRCALGHGPVR